MPEYSEQDRITFCKAVANMIGADHKVTDDEMAHLSGLVLSTGLSPLDARVEREVIPEMRRPGSLKDIVSELEDKSLAPQLFRVLVEVAASDKSVSDVERSKVREAAQVFGLNPDAASELLDWTVASLDMAKKEHEILARL